MWQRALLLTNNLYLSFQVPFSATMSPVRLHSSNPNLCADIEFQTPPSHLTDPLESSTDYTKLQEEFCLIAQKGNSTSSTPLRWALSFGERVPFTRLSSCGRSWAKPEWFVHWLELYTQSAVGEGMMPASWGSARCGFTVLTEWRQCHCRKGDQENRELSQAGQQTPLFNIFLVII